MPKAQPPEKVKQTEIKDTPIGDIGFEFFATAPTNENIKPVLGMVLDKVTLKAEVSNQEKPSIKENIVSGAKKANRIEKKIAWTTAFLTGAALIIENIAAEGAAGLLYVVAMKVLGVTITSFNIPILIVPLILYLGRKAIMRSMVWVKDKVKEKLFPSNNR